MNLGGEERCPNCGALMGIGSDIFKWNALRKKKFLRCPMCGWQSDLYMKDLNRKPVNRFGRKVA